MRHSRLLRTQPSQTICAFCACRLAENSTSVQATRRVSYAHKRQLNTGRPSNQFNPTAQIPDRSQARSEGEPLSGQSSWGNTPIQGDLFGADQSRAALEATKAARKAAETERRGQALAAADDFESQKLFGDNKGQRSNFQAGRNSNGSFRIRKLGVQEAPTSRRLGPRKVPMNVEQVRSRQEHGNPQVRNLAGPQNDRKTAPGPKSTISEPKPMKPQAQAKTQATPLAQVKPQATSSAQAPPQPQAKTKPKVEAPSWVKGRSEDRPAAAVSSWGTAPPPPRTAREKEAADEEIDLPVYRPEEHTNSPEVPLQSTAESDTQVVHDSDSAPFHDSQESNAKSSNPIDNLSSTLDTPSNESSQAQVEPNHQIRDASIEDVFGSQDEESRRILAQSMTQKNQTAMPSSAPKQDSAPVVRYSFGSPGPQARREHGSENPSDFSEEEEKVFQALLARRHTFRSATPTPSENSIGKASGQDVRNPSTETFSPIGTPDADARNMLASQAKQRIHEEQRIKERQELNEPRQRYKISMSNGAQSRENARPFDPEVSANWNIFKQKQQQQEQQDSAYNPQQRSWKSKAEDIDARFQEHLRQRPRSRFDIEKIGWEDAEPPRASHVARRDENRKCIRCGELGHIARNCSNDPLPQYSPTQRWTPRDGFSRGPQFDSLKPDGAQNTESRRAERNPRIRQGLPMTQPEQVERSTSMRTRETEEAEEDDEDDAPTERVLKSRKFADEPVREKDRTRNIRRGRRDEDDDAVAARGRRNRSEDDDAEDDVPRRGRRSLFEEEDEGDLDYENARGARMERKMARQAKKDKAAKDAAKRAANQARKAGELKQIHLPEFISVSNLAQTLGVRYENFVDKMEELGFSNTSYDYVLTAENASLIAMEYQFDPIIGEAQEMEQDERDLKARPEPEDKEFLPSRPPVVAIMGHVDHGKTTILDFLRKSSVAATEHGGITQHIGAFSVGLSSGKTITFLDTPGHAAFLEMRKRGATVTDIIVLVVAADDSVKPQTIEAIKHARAANVPIIVAINKIDKEEANVERVKQDLARHGVEIEDFGGETQVVCVSGKTGAGIDELEDAAVTLSEILDHRAETDGPVEGWVLEATTKKAGRVATVLIKRGTLSPGNIIVAGKTWTRVRTLRNEAGAIIASAGPGTPIEVDGWKDQPKAGDEVLQAPNEQKASDVISYREELEERTKMAEDMEAINETRRLETEKREYERQAAKLAASATAEGDEDVAAAAASKASRASRGLGADAEVALSHQTVPFIVKADVSGSVEAVNAYLLQMSNPLCSPTLLRSGVGAVHEFDIEHAAAAGGHIISFNLPASPETSGQAESKGVKVLEQNVIYRIVEQVKAVLEEKLPPVKTQRVLGEAEVAMAFDIGLGGRRKMRIAGCRVRNGAMGRGSRARVLRGGEKVYDGVVSSLKNVKKDVQEMRKGTECGIGFDDWESFEVGDQVQTYEEKVEKRLLQI